MAAVDPRDGLPAQPKALIWSHPSVDEDAANGRKQFRSHCEILGFLFGCDNPFAVFLTCDHPNLRRYVNCSPFDGQMQNPTEHLQLAIDGRDFEASQLPVRYVRRHRFAIELV